MSRTVTFTVYGKAQPAGSKRAFVNKKTGRAIVTDDNAKSRPWKALVTDAALQAMTYYDTTEIGTHGYLPPLEGPLLLEVTFWIPRPKSHFGSGKNADKLKATAPHAPTVKPDLLKLTRGLEDAMSGVVYRDDAQITEERLEKSYTVGQARTEVRISAEAA